MTPSPRSQENAPHAVQTGLKLAVCIPTYNRAAYIEQALSSVLAQLPAHGVEIVVVDNHSTDNTEAIVSRVMQGQQGAGAVRYIKRDVNVGADRNIVEACEFSQAQYFWIFGSDDAMPAGAIDKVLRAIEDGQPNLILGDANDCDLELKQTGVLKFLRCEGRDFDFSRRQDVDAYLDAVTMTASLFGFIGSMVYKRSAWDQVPISLYTYGTAYAQVFRALDVVFRVPGNFRYLGQAIANNRRNNCSYTAEFGEIQRYLIDLRMFRMAIDTYFSQDLRMRNRFKQFVRTCFGRMGQEKIRTGIVVMDDLLKFFEEDDGGMPEILPWQLYPLVDRACRRMRENGMYQQVFEGKSILHFGYRHEGAATIKPVNEGAVGVDAGYSGYNGIRLPFESGSQDSIYLSDVFPSTMDTAAAAVEWMRVLRPDGNIVVSNTLRANRGPGAGLTVSSLLALFEVALPAGSFRVAHCQETGDLHGAEVDLVLRRVAPVASIDELAAQATRLHAEGKLAEAEALAGQALERAPRNTLALQLLGQIAYQSGRHADAVLRFTAALAIDGQLAEARLNLGCAYAALGGNAEAMQCFADAIALRPDFVAAAQNLALLRGTSAQHDALRGNFIRLLQTHPLLDAARRNLVQS